MTTTVETSQVSAILALDLRLASQSLPWCLTHSERLARERVKTPRSFILARAQSLLRGRRLKEKSGAFLRVLES